MGPFVKSSTLDREATGANARSGYRRPDARQALAGILAGALAGLQCVGRAAAVVDDGGEIVAMNALARPLMTALARPQPSAGGEIARHGLQDLVAAVLHRHHAGTATTMIDLAGRGRVIVRATDMRLVEPGLVEAPHVLLDLAELEPGGLPTSGVLRRMLGLTATEAEVALALACGATASAIARDRAVSLETVRSHLKTIFAKTGARRQATLVALVLQLRGVSSPG